MSVLRTGVHGVDCHGVVPVAYMGTGALGAPPLDFDEALCTFTAGMAKRDTSAGVFAASPIVQGDWDGTGTPDILSHLRGALVSGNFYANLDPYQGSFVCFWTPERDSGSGDISFLWYGSGQNSLRYTFSTGAFLLRIGGQNFTVASAAVAGTSYCLIGRWDTKNTLDGTNYLCLSINGVHSFGITTQPTVAAPDATEYIGSTGTLRPANAIIEGLTIYRRPLWDGDYGVDVGNGDEVALISAGVDPCTVTGSWDVVFACPTNAAVGALVTGMGEAWSHPHSAAETNLTDAYCQTAYIPGAWADEGTPVTPAAYDFDGAATLISCGSNAALDDLCSQPAGKGTLTAEAWIRADGWGEGGLGIIFEKGRQYAAGWAFMTLAGNGLYAIVECAVADGYSRSGTDDFSPDGRWHHVAMCWDDLTYNYPLIWVDGIEASYSLTSTRNGAVNLDAVRILTIGNHDGAGATFDGKIAWCRLSNVIRYASPFVPPPLTNPPAVDGNTVEQWNMQDCAGVTAVAQVNAGAPPGGCDGQITAGAGGWNCVKDMDDFAVGDRRFQWGYIFGSDAANEGITQTAPGAPLTAGQDYVLRVPVNLGADSNGRARIRVRDMTNAANIVDFDGPLMTGAHTGANNSATLIVAGARFPQSLIGTTVYNITDVNPAGNDCGKGVATSISGDGTTITFAGGLSGGTDNDFDTGDTYRVVWHRTAHGVRSMPADHPWCEPFTFELPTNARHGVGADCVSISVKVLNSLASGTVMCHQVELQENLVDNPSVDIGAVIPPWIPLGWLHSLEAGDSQQGATVHSGAASFQSLAMSATGDNLYQNIAGNTIGAFYAIGQWFYKTAGNCTGGAWSGLYYQATTGTYARVSPTTFNMWTQLMAVGRAFSTLIAPWLDSDSDPFQGFTDDFYLFQLDDVTLTATAANQADSEE